MAAPTAKNNNDASVLVLYTGGTIGMLSTKFAYIPEPGYITHYLRSQSRFHDPQGESLFSNSSSATSYRTWSAKHDAISSTDLAIKTARSSLTTTTSSSSSPSASNPNQQDDTKDNPKGKEGGSNGKPNFINPDGREEWLEGLITPPVGKDGRRIKYCIKEYDPLIDSPDVTKDDWIRLATDIESNYANYDGFVILHGTDTMAYTSSALSFLLEDLGKTVIVTGAQVPFGQWRNDAVDNFMGSLVLAGTYVIPEVCLFFNETLMRGNRARKTSSSDFDAFQSPNLEPLAILGLDIDVDWSLVSRPTSLQSFKAHKAMNPDVAILQVFPDIPTSTMKTFLSAPVKGVVLETFGAGNIPQRKELIEAIREATSRDVVIVNITQCPRGSVMAGYPAQRLLAEAGIVTGADMTPECASTKLSYLLSKPEYSIQRVRQLMATPLRGEMTASKMPTIKPHQAQANEVHGLLAHMLTINAVDNAVFSPPSSPRMKAESADPSWIENPQDSQQLQSLLLPYLLCLACAKNQLSSVISLIRRVQELETSSNAGHGHGHGHPAGQAQEQSLINLLDPAFGKNALHVAAMHGSDACVEKLLSVGALVHQKDRDGHTPLYYAMKLSDSHCTTLLQQAGALLGNSEQE